MATDKLVDFDHVTDYISREAAIEKITALINKSGKYTAYESGADDACFILEHEIPAADVVEVVRCKDCIYYNTTGCAVGFGWCEEPTVSNGVDDNYYCAGGIRRDDDG